MHADHDRTENDDRIALLVAFLRLSALISRPMRDGVADPAGISPNELRLMMALSGEGEAAGHELAELMGMHAMNVSRSLSSLHDLGLVKPAVDSANRRRRPFRLSDQGQAAFRAMESDIASVADFLLGSLSANERKTLKKLLLKVDGRIMVWQAPEHHPHVPRA
jgi:DNA-binding MarR family transcriptional regulator